MNISNINNFINVKIYILKCFAHAVAQATDEVVGDMKCFADMSLKRSEFFTYNKLDYKNYMIYLNNNHINSYILNES